MITDHDVLLFALFLFTFATLYTILNMLVQYNRAVREIQKTDEMVVRLLRERVRK